MGWIVQPTEIRLFLFSTLYNNQMRMLRDAVNFSKISMLLRETYPFELNEKVRMKKGIRMKQINGRNAHFFFTLFVYFYPDQGNMSFTFPYCKVVVVCFFDNLLTLTRNQIFSTHPTNYSILLWLREKKNKKNENGSKLKIQILVEQSMPWPR